MKIKMKRLIIHTLRRMLWTFNFCAAYYMWVERDRFIRLFLLMIYDFARWLDKQFHFGNYEFFRTVDPKYDSIHEFTEYEIVIRKIIIYVILMPTGFVLIMICIILIIVLLIRICKFFLKLYRKR